MEDDRDAVRARLRELGLFLRAKRGALSPSVYNIATRRRRLSPGLSRAEAAALANIGSSWYARLEAGRVPRPTMATICAVSRILQLTPNERNFALSLAGLPAELGDSSTGTRSAPGA